MHPCPRSTQEEEDLALARALSASEAEYQQSQRQVSEAGRGLCAVVGLILAWLGEGGTLPGFCLLWALSRLGFLTRRAAQPGAVAASLLSTQLWELQHWICPLVGERKKPVLPCSLCASLCCRLTVQSHQTAACRRQVRQGVPADTGSHL